MKFESIDLKKFDSSSVDQISQAGVKGGIKCYMVSAKKEGDGTITDAGMQHDSGL